MKTEQKFNIYLFIVFLTCFLSFIVLTNIHMTQLREREKIENENQKIRNEINSYINQNIGDIYLQSNSLTSKYNFVTYDEKEVVTIK